jgi:hypothetical protein
MHPSRTSPVVDAITTFAERWITQDTARVNAAQAAGRLQRQRRQLDDVTSYLADNGWPQPDAGPRDEPAQGRRPSTLPP